MEREDGKAAPTMAVLESEIVADRRLLGDAQEVEKRINHNVADKMDGRARAAFVQQVLDRTFFGDEKVGGKSVSENAIDFFGHGAVEAAKASFDVGDGNAKFCSGEGHGDGGVDVADDEDEVGLELEKDRLNALEDLGGLHRVRGGADLEIHGRRGNAHLAEENIGEGVVVVLAGMDQNGIDFFGMALHFAKQWRDFREIGAGAHDIDDFEATAAHETGDSPMEGGKAR